MRNISSWSIRNPIFPIVLFIGLTMLGVLAFNRLPINNNPDISFPFVAVNVSQPGAAPAEIESQITKIIEPALANIQGVKNLTSRASEGYSFTGVEFYIGTPVDRAVNDVRDAVAKVRSELPDGIIEPSIERQDTDGGAIAYYTVATKNMTAEQLSWFVDNIIAKRLKTVSGVSQVFRSGGIDREIRIDLQPDRLQAFGITAAEVNQQLRILNLDAPGGRGEIGGAEQTIRVLGGAKTAGDLGNARISLSNGSAVRLNDIARVHDGAAEKRNLSRLNGQEVTQFSVFKAKGFSEVTVGTEVEKKIAEIVASNKGVKITLVYTTVQYTIEQYRSAINAMIEGAILAVIVVWFFLRDWRAMLISAIAIPLSAIPTFWIMELLGFTLNGISLLALSLVAGILVDDAIVEIENIVRHMRMGKTAYQASMDAADEIGLAVVATTLAIVAVFLPVGFMSGIAGQFFKQFGLTVVFAVLFSLLVARMITPLLAAYFLRSGGQQAHGDSWWIKSYINALHWTLRNRWKTMGLALLCIVGTVGLGMLLPRETFPPFDDGNTQVAIEMAPGSRLQDTSRVAAQATAILRAEPEVLRVTEDINVNDATLYATLVPKKEREVSVVEFNQRVAPKLRQIADARVNFRSQSNGFGRDYNVVLSGADTELLDQTIQKLIVEMRGVKILRDPRINGDLQRPELIIKPNFDLAAQLGVSVGSLSQTIRIATIGDVPQNLAKFSASDRQIPIRVALPEDARKNLSVIENLPVPTSSGTAVPLKAVADISFGQGPTTIRRFNQSRRVVVEADFAPGVKFSVAQKAIDELPTMKNLPQGIEIVKTGDTEVFAELVSGLIIAFVTAMFLVTGVLVLLYHKVLLPIVNILSMFLAPLGSIIGLLIAGFAFSMPVAIGLLLLAGIVVKNSILLIDFAIEEMRKGVEKHEAMLEAAHKRAQPIVMTTVAMVAGMIPISLGIGGDASFRAPMGVAVMGGLITSTALTLLIVPAAFSLMCGAERRVGKLTGRLLTHDELPTAQQQPAE
jgi:multidrug efflux pump subunit AcrB